MSPRRVVSLGVHIVDVLARPVASPPLAGGRHLVEEVRITAAGTAAGTSVDARSSASMAAAALPASFSACASLIWTPKLPGLSAASVFNWSRVAASGILGVFNARRIAA